MLAVHMNVASTTSFGTHDTLSAHPDVIATMHNLLTAVVKRNIPSTPSTVRGVPVSDAKLCEACDDNGYHKCTNCKSFKPHSSFVGSSKKKARICIKCNDCRASMKKWRNESPIRIRRRKMLSECLNERLIDLFGSPTYKCNCRRGDCLVKDKIVEKQYIEWDHFLPLDEKMIERLTEKYGITRDDLKYFPISNWLNKIARLDPKGNILRAQLQRCQPLYSTCHQRITFERKLRTPIKTRGGRLLAHRREMLRLLKSGHVCGKCAVKQFNATCSCMGRNLKSLSGICLKCKPRGCDCEARAPIRCLECGRTCVSPEDSVTFDLAHNGRSTRTYDHDKPLCTLPMTKMLAEIATTSGKDCPNGRWLCHGVCHKDETIQEWLDTDAPPITTRVQPKFKHLNEAQKNWLKQKKMQYPSLTPTRLQEQFNLAFPKRGGISVFAIRQVLIKSGLHSSRKYRKRKREDLTQTCNQ